MFNADDLIWIDFEVFGGALDLKAAGAFRYVAEASTHTIVLSYAIGNAPALTWHADGAILDWNCAPNELRAAYERRKTFAAWNASFDAAVWNYATLGFPFLAPERVIDPMVQAGVSNLPTDLEHADPNVQHRRREPTRMSGGVEALSRLCASGCRGDARCVSQNAPAAA